MSDRRVSRLRSRLAEVTWRLRPAARRWRRFLRELPLDPETLPRPLPAPADRDFIICGSPRSGTTLLAAALYQPPKVVTVAEPWDGMRMPPADLFASLRREISETGRLTRQRLDVHALLRDGTAERCLEGAVVVDVPVEEGYHLGVKWPDYWRYLDLLPGTRFLVTLRHPAEIIASYRSSSRRLAQGLNNDTAFNRSSNRLLEAATSDPALRRVLLHDYIHERILPHLGRPNVFAVRYERWFGDRKRLMEELSAFLGVPLGPGPVTIRIPTKPALPQEELALLRARCATAEALGYSLSTPVS